MEEKKDLPVVELISDLRRKAEICRFSHSKIKNTCRLWKNVNDLSITVLSLSSAFALGLYLREFWDEKALLAILFLSLFIAFLQQMDSTVFQWSKRHTRHQTAIDIWGSWIREAAFFEKLIQKYPDQEKKDKVENLLADYRYCMAITEQIPNNKFLEYKEKFYQQVLASKELDEVYSNLSKKK